MDARLIAFLILLPFTLAFLYAAIHEYLRYKSQGSATYGLAYNEETGTTHVTGISEEDEAYDPEDYDPADYNDPEFQSGSDPEKT
ncbi:hypothetical protein ACX9MO_17630 [Pseudooceanicola sp. 502str34]|uniref:hypothetical protein n=1 Tax=Maritimibacter alkaliphilus TaxID=404236 RepID=UPI001C95DAD5|nr:hypothetical protein [Maritimibacter alkaliphilus]MBY6089666.1 hypothetical protein [Maritimibacter alkaliphilus]